MNEIVAIKISPLNGTCWCSCVKIVDIIAPTIIPIPLMRRMRRNVLAEKKSGSVSVVAVIPISDMIRKIHVFAVLASLCFCHASILDERDEFFCFFKIVADYVNGDFYWCLVYMCCHCDVSSVFL